MKESTSFADWLTIAQCSEFEMRVFTRPYSVGGVRTMESLDDITFGQLLQLSEIGETDDSFYRICEILLDLSRAKVRKAHAVDVVRFVGWVSGEVKKISSLFAKVSVKPTKEEEMAGIDQLQFGLFGTLDWFARRMGITNHEEVLKVPWMQVYKCMEMDAATILYNRRYQKVISNEQRRKTKTHH